MSARLAAVVLSEASTSLAAGVGWREGQAAFNALHVLAPRVADEVRGTAVDPYYSDARLSAFYTWLSAHDYR